MMPKGKAWEIMNDPVPILYMTVISRLKWYFNAQSPIQQVKIAI